MAKLLTYFIVGLFCVFSLTSFADAQNPQVLMATIYGGLADIIEANINNPSQCIAAVENFCQKHKADIVALSVISQARGQQALEQDYSQEDMDMEKMQQAFEAMAKNKGFQELNRFMQALQNFSMQNSDHREELGDAIEKGFPQPKVDY